MKASILLATVCLSAVLSAQGAFYTETYNSGFENSGNIPDGNINPWSDTRTLSGITDLSITSVSVRLNVSGGYNGDLYAYLSHGGVLVPLLNRVGVGTGDAFGYGDAGFNITLLDTALNNIHLYQDVGGYDITGGASWQPDGRTINPVTSLPSAFDAAGTVNFGAYDGLNPNGDWSLVFADLSAGGGQASVVSWGLDITAVPEPTHIALGIFGSLWVSVNLWRRWRGRRL